jgi:hypothetical protein
MQNKRSSSIILSLGVIRKEVVKVFRSPLMSTTTYNSKKGGRNLKKEQRKTQTKN